MRQFLVWFNGQFFLWSWKWPKHSHIFYICNSLTVNATFIKIRIKLDLLHPCQNIDDLQHSWVTLHYIWLDNLKGLGNRSRVIEHDHLDALLSWPSDHIDQRPILKPFSPNPERHLGHQIVVVTAMLSLVKGHIIHGDKSEASHGNRLAGSRNTHVRIFNADKQSHGCEHK